MSCSTTSSSSSSEASSLQGTSGEATAARVADSGLSLDLWRLPEASSFKSLSNETANAGGQQVETGEQNVGAQSADVESGEVGLPASSISDGNATSEMVVAYPVNPLSKSSKSPKSVAVQQLDAANDGDQSDTDESGTSQGVSVSSQEPDVDGDGMDALEEDLDAYGFWRLQREMENTSPKYENLFGETHRQRFYRRACLIPLFVACVAVLLTLLVLLVGKDGHSPEETTADVSGKSPTPVPYTFHGRPTEEDDMYESFLIDFIQTKSPSTSFDNPSSPQRRALDWMLADATLIDGYDHKRMLQRFALATMAFSFNLTEKVFRPDDNVTSECDWSDFWFCNEQLDVTSVHVAKTDLAGAVARRGSIPREIALLSSLFDLHLSNDKVGGTIPSELGELTALMLLSLASSRLKGTIPMELSRLTGLSILEIDGKMLQGPIPSEIGLLTNLEVLRLTSDNMSGPIPTELSNLSHLVFFDVSGKNQLSGAVPASLCGTLEHAAVSELVDCECCLPG